jgi:glutaconate CoA-transferase subunit B
MASRKALPSDSRTRMVCAAASELRDRDVVFVGIGLPSVACNLALRTHAPNLKLIYESGAIGTHPERNPISIGDPALVAGADMVAPMADVFQLVLQRGHVDVGFLGAAQIDRFANINTTVIGHYDAPRVRLPGSGGATEIATHARRVLVVTKLERRAFPNTVDFVTSPGRRVRRVITDKCIFDNDPFRGELVLAALYEGVTEDEVRDNVGWDLGTSEKLSIVPTPSEAVLRELGKLQRT